MGIMTTVSATGSTTGAQTSAASSGLSSNYELFLTLLTTQVQNQDPLDPMDSAEYTNQLVQYSAVEQSLQTNSLLEQMLASQNSAQAASYVSYIGQDITADGTTKPFENGAASWSYEIAQQGTGTVEIKNSRGSTVYRTEVTLPQGTGTFTWDGRTIDGTTAPNGDYSIVFDVKDDFGAPEKVTTDVSGRVDGVDLS
ncbi:flagellar hook assembly protein FlgD, partial [Roseibium hamelinense]|nr:flagellar hook assembly protein FlgD [Roseibium hamelinense]